MIRLLVPLVLGFSMLEGIDKNSSKTDLDEYQELFLDQRLEESVTSFLRFLDLQKSNEATISPSENFNEAYKIYLNTQGKSSQEIAIQMIDKYGETASDPYLNYLLAASYANLGRFDRFYPLFLSAYRNDPNHYLADKMRAVLHIKLYERLPLGLEKEEERAQIMSSLQKAQLKNPSDHMLYKMMIAFCPEADRSKQVDILVRKMIDSQVLFPRTDLLFYVRAALSVGNVQLAQQFINYSRTLFGYSRSLEAAQNIIDSKEL